MKKINFYKTYGLWLTAIVVLAFTTIFMGCEQFDLDEQPSKSILAVLPYESQAELDLAVTGIYGRMRNTFWMTTAFVSAWGGDDLTTHRASNKADFREYDQRAVTDGNARTRGTYQEVYASIRAANNVIINAAQSNLPDKQAADRLVGEAHFLRGYLYHHLIRVFEQIPIVTEITPDFEIGLSSREEVYELIESDYLQAESVLPAKTTVGATRPNAGTARAFLARLYLDWAGYPLKNSAKYADAASSAKKVIDNATAHGFDLVPNMGSLYTVAGGLNPEGVFTFAYCNSCGLANRKNGKLGLPGDFGGWQESFAEIRFFEDFPEGPRKEATYHTKIPLAADGKVTANVAGAAKVVPWTEFKDQQNPIFRKLVGPFEDNVFNDFQTTRSDYFMRYAEVLLTFAEASGRSGSATPAAWEALNQVRRRANGLPANTADAKVDVTSGDLADLAFTERKWELAGEYQRWFDLVRTEKVQEALGGTARNPKVSIGTSYDAAGVGTPKPLTEPSNPILGPLDNSNYFSKIPPDEIAQLPKLGG